MAACRTLAWSLIVLLLLPVHALAQGDPSAPGPGFVRVGTHEGGAEAMDLHGDRLAWAALENDSVILLLSNLTTGDTQVVTRVPGGEQGIGVGSLAYDGRHLVWTDDRFGNLDVFAYDTEQGVLDRVTDHPAPDRQVDAWQGQVVFTRQETLYLTDLATGNVTELASGVGSLPDPAIDTGRVAWSQPTGRGGAVILVRELGDEQARAMPGHPNGSSFEPRISGDRVIWTTLVFNQSGSQRRGVEGALLQMADLSPPEGTGLETTFQNLTPSPGNVKAPTIGAGWVAWLELPQGGQPFLQVQQVDGERAFTVPGPVSMGHLSSTHLVVVLAEEERAPVYALDLTAQPSHGGGPAISWELAGLGLALIGIGVAWGYMRRKGGDL